MLIEVTGVALAIVVYVAVVHILVPLLRAMCRFGGTDKPVHVEPMYLEDYEAARERQKGSHQ